MVMGAGTTKVVPQRGRAARIALYVGQMFPLPVMLPFAACHFFAIWFALQALSGAPTVRIGWTAVRGAVTVALFLLIMRLYDELKDAATDIALGRAGDPLYRDRVLVTGAVRIEDVLALRWIVTAALIALNLPIRLGWAPLAFWVTFGTMWLSFHWFFRPSMARNLLLAFVTHNPIALLVIGYVAALFADEFRSGLPRGVVPLVLGLWFPLAAWETSRKVRIREDETSYRTYSQVLGWRAAGLMPAVFVTSSATALLIVATMAELGIVFSAVLAAVCAIVVFRCVLFSLAPSRARANLKPWAMLYAAVANAGLAIAVIAGRHVIW
jgi:hypothetical protein